MARCRTALLVAAFLTVAAAAAGAQEPNFGRAIALTPSDLLIGQPVNWYGPGTVYAYRLDAAGEWQEHSRLAAPDSSRMDDFGRAFALDGNTLVVGAPRKRAGTGVAYAFTRESPGAPWTHTQTLTPPAGVDGSEYAVALSLSGVDLLIGAPSAEETGVVHHFRREGPSWTLVATLRPEGSPGTEGFGASIGRQGEWLLVGAPASDSDAGRVFAARRQADGGWSAPEAVPVAGGERAALGASVRLDGERAYVGAPGASAVHVLTRDASGDWRAGGTLESGDAPSRSGFGQAVEVVQGEVWVGAPGLNGGAGRVYRFLPDGQGGWQPPRPIDADSADGTHWPFNFGYAIAAAGERAVVGMPQRDFGEGRALALARVGEGWQARQVLEGEIHRIGRTLEPGDQCQGGTIDEFPCANIQVVAHMPISELGGARGVWVNDVWGWTDPDTGREYALVARRDGASFVEVTDPASPRLVGNLPRTEGSPPSVWRDIKVVGNHAFIVSDGARDHGMQVFDLTRLRAVTGAPATFEPDVTYREIASAHNVVADTASGFVYVVGAGGGGQTCGSGLHMVDVRDPLDPTFAGCYHDATANNSRGYTHDAQCLVYQGPDARYAGRQICVASNEEEINIADVTDKSNPETIGRASYPNVAYAHQGWFDEEQRYFYMNDEGDEAAGLVDGTRTIVWDLSELDNPLLAREYFGPVPSSDHNLFVRGDRAYLSNYGSGLRVLDISDRTNPHEIASFDSAPYNRDEPGFSAAVSGAWSNYPFFESGVVVFTSVREGLFIVRVTPPLP